MMSVTVTVTGLGIIIPTKLYSWSESHPPWGEGYVCVYIYICSSIQNQLPDPMILISHGSHLYLSPDLSYFMGHGSGTILFALYCLLFPGPPKNGVEESARISLILGSSDR